VSNYTQITDFSAKDALATGDANKKILGSDMDAELAAISTAIATKGDDSGLVHTTGTETVAGDKTLSGNNTHSGTNTVSGALNVSGITTHTNKVVMTSKPVWLAEGASVASASDCDIWAAGDGNTVHVTGTTTITDWGTAPQAGAWMRVVFDGVLQLTYNATTNALPTSANITTEAGDSCIVYADSTSAYSIYDYTRQSGKPLVDYETAGPVLLESGSASAASTKDIALDAYPTYTHFKIRLRNVHASAASDLYLRYSTDSGSSFVTTSGYSYIGSYISNTGTPAQTLFSDGGSAADQINLTGGGSLISNNATWGYGDLEIDLFGALDTSVTAKIKWTGALNSGGQFSQVYISGMGEVQTGSNDVTDIRFLLSTGTVSFDYELYGWN